MGLVDMILNAIASNKDIQDKIDADPTTKEYYSVLKSGNASQGEALANRIIQQYGLTKEQAIEQAKNGLNQMFGGQR